MKVPAAVHEAHLAALAARQHAHAPYSRFKVGAALVVKPNGKKRVADQIICGCNVENASYGGTVCAERVAIHRAVAEWGQFRAQFLLVVTGETQATVPCALCLQTLAEFCGDELPIYLANTKDVVRKITLRELLPFPFRQFKRTKS